MVLRIQHETKLSYTSAVSETVFEVRMAPPTDDDQTALSYRLQITPNAPVMTYRDGFGNRVELFNVPTSYRELTLQSTSFVRVHRRPAVERLAGLYWPNGDGAIDRGDGVSLPPALSSTEAPRSTPSSPESASRKARSST